MKNGTLRKIWWLFSGSPVSRMKETLRPLFLNGCIAAVILSLGSTLGAANDSSASKLFDLAIKQREQWVTGVCKIEGIIEEAHLPEPTPVMLQYQFDFENRSYRVTEQNGSTCIFTDRGFYIQPQLHQNQFIKFEPPAFPPFKYAFDIRTLGLPTKFQSSRSNSFDIFTDIYSHCEGMSLQQDDGLQKLSFLINKPDAHFVPKHHVWLDPTKDFSITKYVVEHPEHPGEDHFIVELNSIYLNNTWVPTSVKHRSGRYSDHYKMDIDISWEVLNQPLGMRLDDLHDLAPENKRTRILSNVNNDNVLIEIDSIDKRPESEIYASLTAPAKPKPQPVSYSRFLVLVGAVLIVSALVWQLRLFKRVWRD